MNRRTRRANPEIAKMEEGQEPLSFGPLYQADIKMHLGASPLWQRDEAVNKHRTLQARAPDVMWQDTLLAITEMLGMAENRFLFGLLWNLINRWPEDVRLQFLAGIIGGVGMTVKAGYNEVVVEVLEGTFETLNLQPDGTLEHKTASGLIIPDAGLVVARA